MSTSHPVFTSTWAEEHFPAQRTDDFFEALFGGAEEGAYDIRLRYANSIGHTHHFFLDLHQRPGMCLACNLTYGLPQVFARHPIINIKGIAEAVATALGTDPAKVTWQLGTTQETSAQKHSIPLAITVS